MFYPCVTIAAPAAGNFTLRTGQCAAVAALLKEHVSSQTQPYFEVDAAYMGYECEGGQERYQVCLVLALPDTGASLVLSLAYGPLPVAVAQAMAFKVAPSTCGVEMRSFFMCFGKELQPFPTAPGCEARPADAPPMGERVGVCVGGGGALPARTHLAAV